MALNEFVGIVEVLENIEGLREKQLSLRWLPGCCSHSCRYCCCFCYCFIHFGQHGLLHLQLEVLQEHLLQSVHVSQWQGEPVLQLQGFIASVVDKTSR